MNQRFDEEKTTQAALYLLGKRGGTMSYMKLIKLLYLADREALLRWARPITFDRYFSMNHGPVLSQTYRLIADELPPGQTSFWQDHIALARNKSVSIARQAEPDRLSQAEISLLDEIFTKYGQMNRWDLVNNVAHGLPEWVFPDGTSLPITYRDILKVNNRTESEIAAIEADLEEAALAKTLLVR
jgi:uncharacterized phage-associated protein